MTSASPASFGPPPDLPSMAAMVAAGLLAWQGRALLGALLRVPRQLAVTLLAALALALSAGYIQHYLRGGPRIIDATSYWLQARALSEGYVTWPIAEPTAAVRGRFLLMSGAPEAPRLGVIFPPGYPLVLALGLLLHAPLWTGPVIAALLVVATYALARLVTERDEVAMFAACLSVLSAALRYHTADTMSHGWAALLLTSTLAFVYWAAESDSRKQVVRAGFAGLAFGWLFATRPVSALALLPLVVFAASELRSGARIALGVATFVPAFLFVFEQRAVTGSFLQSSQAAYYAVADGPPSCFRYGFGTGIGCLHEHGDYVASVLPNGFSWTAAAMVTLRRIRLHLTDVANAEPLAALAAAAPFLALRRANRLPASPRFHTRRILAVAIAVVLVVLAYVSFYFDGSYAGGGARLFADVLPLEHVLIAVAIALLFDRVGARAAFFDFRRAAALVLAVSALGFAVHAAYQHVMLRERDGGRPYFEPGVLADAKIDHGLLFTGTDHAFNLVYDPRAHDPSREILVAREYGDDRDRQVWERLGHPLTHRYIFDGSGSSEPSVVAWAPGPIPHPYRFEAEAEWPPIAQSGGYFEPVFASGTCAWGGKLLAIRMMPDRAFQGSISFPVPFAGRFRVAVHLASQGSTTARFALRQNAADPPLATWSFVPARKTFVCASLAEEEVNLSERGLLEVTSQGEGDLYLDAIAVEPASPVEYAR